MTLMRDARPVRPIDAPVDLAHSPDADEVLDVEALAEHDAGPRRASPDVALRELRERGRELGRPRAHPRVELRVEFFDLGRAPEDLGDLLLDAAARGPR